LIGFAFVRGLRIGAGVDYAIRGAVASV